MCLFKIKNHVFFNIKILLILIIGLNSIFADSGLLTFKQNIGFDDPNNNLFYIDEFGELTIPFNISSNYSKTNVYLMEDPKIKLSYHIYDNFSNINYILSNDDISFSNTLNKSVFLHITTNNFKNTSTRLKVQVDLYDEYDNLLDTQRIYLRFKSNNSKVYYPNTKDHSKPKFLGYNYSRKFAILQSNSDKDIISIYLKTEDPNYFFTLNCSSDSNLLLTFKVNDNNYSNINLEIKTDINKTLTNKVYVISCYAQDSVEKIKLEDIFVKYIPLDSNLNISNFENNKLHISNMSKVTAFFSLNGEGWNVRYFLLGLVIICVLLLFIKVDH